MNKFLVLLIMHLSTPTFTQNIQNDTLKNLELSIVTIVGNRAKSIPGSGQYIGSRQLEKLNQSNVNNVLRIIPGVNIRDEEGFGLRPNIGLRGTSVNRSAKITLMEDGILIAPAPYSDPSAYYFPTFARMQGVEVLKGSSQIKYGPYTIGGAVNLISTSIPESFKGFAQLSYGSFGTNQQRFWVGDCRKNFDYVLEVNRLASKGFKELDNGGNTGFDRRDMMGKFRWHTDSSVKISQSIMLKFVNSTEDGNETYLGLTYDDYNVNPLRRYSATQKDMLDLKHNHISLNHTISPAQGLSISTTAYFSGTFRDWARVNSVDGQNLNNILRNPVAHQSEYQIMIGKAVGNIDFQSAARAYFSKGLQASVQYLFNMNKITHNIQLGFRYHIDQADRYATRSTYTMTNGTMVLATEGVKGNQENQIRNANSFATYLSYDITYKGLKVSPGIRHEKINFDFQNFGNADNARLGTALKSATNDLSILLPGLGVKYEFNESTNAFAGIHKGFSPPGMPSVTSVNEQAKAETAYNYEFGYNYSKKAFNVQLVGFFSNYANILGSDNVSGGGAGTGDMFNAGKAKIQGLEVSLSYDLLHRDYITSELKLPINISYTYTEARFKETFINGGGDWGSGTIAPGDFIPFVTPHLVTTSISLETQKFNTTLVSRYVGETRVKSGQGTIVVPDANVNYADVNAIAGYLILDLSANYKLGKNFTAFTNINNITNNKSIVANLPQGYRPNMPFGINVGLKVEL